MEFSKKLLIADYLILIILLICTMIFSGIDLVTLDIAWIAQIAISSGFYYWKSKCENRTKVPFKVIESMPEDMRESLDLTTIIVSIIQSE